VDDDLFKDVGIGVHDGLGSAARGLSFLQGVAVFFIFPLTPYHSPYHINEGEYNYKLASPISESSQIGPIRQDAGKQARSRL
jgi:hypothetical protein